VILTGSQAHVDAVAALPGMTAMATMMMRAMLPHNPPIGVKDPQYHGTPLGWCVYGSLHGWHCGTGDFATTVRLLLEAGERPDPTHVPIGRDDVDDVLRAQFARGD